MSDPTAEIAHEQAYLTDLYRHLDTLRDRAADRLRQALRHRGGTQQAQSERESAVTLYSNQLAQFGAVEHGLCFGRLDLVDDARPRYIGRIGLFDEDYEPMLVDWRAPAGRPFYVATAATPEGVRRRRHIRTAGRTVVGLSDDLLDLDGETGGPTASESALLAALSAHRTGRMRDIVETIQAEQDDIIRSGINGVLVVQGGPGTGKTAVALHRAAYLLYTHRERLGNQGVLIVGPNHTFLRYIGDVLPSLAENGVLSRTLGDLFPGEAAHRAEPAAVAAVKGRPEMAEVIAAAVADREEIPAEGVEVRLDDETVRVPHDIVVRAVARTRRTGRPHNLARPVFVDAMVDALAREVAERVGHDPFADDPLGGDDAPGAGTLLVDEQDIAEMARELRGRAEVQAVLTRLWPVLTPQQLLEDLFADPARLRSAAPSLTDDDRELLLREPGGGFTPADVPLLDEAAELLGEDDRAALVRAELARRQRIMYAQELLEISEGSSSVDAESADGEQAEWLTFSDLLDAEQLAERYEVREQSGPANDRNWVFGHVIVDEAQELSPMAWRLLMRRCPQRSMTVVGDIAQTGDLAGTANWADAFAPYVGDRWRRAELTINYRTPAEIMAVAARVLAAIDPDLSPPTSVRETGVPPVFAAETALASVVGDLADAVKPGRVAVLVPAGRLAEVRDRLPIAGTDLDAPVTVLTTREAKGLEFDAVAVVDPAAIVAESPRGLNDLYVALTRATQQLAVIGELPLDLR